MQALYRFYDGRDQLLYIGISSNFQARFSQHAKNSEWHALTTRATITHYEDRDAVVEAEKAAIIAEKPIFNKQHNRPDDVLMKHYYQILKNDVELNDDFHCQLVAGVKSFQDLGTQLPTRCEPHMINAWAIRGAMRALDKFGNGSDDDFILDCKTCQSLNEAEFFDEDVMNFWANLGQSIKNLGRKGQ